VEHVLHHATNPVLKEFQRRRYVKKPKDGSRVEVAKQTLNSIHMPLREEFYRTGQPNKALEIEGGLLTELEFVAALDGKYLREELYDHLQRRLDEKTDVIRQAIRDTRSTAEDDKSSSQRQSFLRNREVKIK
jgi:hypothetical protein